jgi:hypothetical protein
VDNPKGCEGDKTPESPRGEMEMAQRFDIVHTFKHYWVLGTLCFCDGAFIGE